MRYKRARIACICVAIMSVLGFTPSHGHAELHSPAAPQDRVLLPGPPPLTLIPYAGLLLHLRGGGFVAGTAGDPCCEYSARATLGGVFGARMFFPLPDVAGWRVSPRIAIEDHAAFFRSQPYTFPIRGAGDRIESAVLERTVELPLTVLSVEALAAWSLPIDGDVYAAGGLAAHLRFSGTAAGQERILGPSGVRFLSGHMGRPISETLPELSTAGMSLRLGIGAFLTVPAGFTINPELLVSLPILEEASGGGWSTTTIMLGVGVQLEL